MLLTHSIWYVIVQASESEVFSEKKCKHTKVVRLIALKKVHAVEVILNPISQQVWLRCGFNSLHKNMCIFVGMLSFATFDR